MNLAFPKPSERSLPRRPKGRTYTAKDCLECGGEFKVDRAFLQRRGARFCSVKCWYEWKRKKSPIKAQLKIKFATRKCIVCGGEFKAEKRKKFCSPKCYGVAQRKVVVLACQTCGGEVRRRPSTRQGRRVFCSRVCQGLGNRGEASALFRGNRRQYRGKDWKEQSAAARTRDGHQCRGCEARVTQKLSVDHIVPYRLAKELHAASPELPPPNDLINLISLCRKCHGKKLVPEARLLKGDVLGFISEVKKIFTADAVDDALRAFKLAA